MSKKGDVDFEYAMKELPPPGWKRNPALLNLKKADETISNKLFLAIDSSSPLGALKPKLEILELTAHTLANFGVIAFLWWFCVDRDNKAFFTNLLFAFFVDAAAVAVVKAIARRRRPGLTRELYERNPSTTNLSFPSGCASRATLFLMILWYNTEAFFLFPLLVLAWGAAVSGAKILLARNFIGDAIAGVVLGFLQYILLFSWMWLDASDISALETFFAG